MSASRCLFLVFLLASMAHAAAAGRNLLLNGTFDHPRAGIPEEWQWGEGVTSTLAGPDGSRCLKIASSVAQYAMSGQYLFLDGRRVQQITLSGRVRTKNVLTGKNAADRCRIMLMFFDRRDGQIGEIHDVGLWEGTRPWSRFSQTLAVPAATRRVEVSMGLHNTSGVCWFDDLCLQIAAGDRVFRSLALNRTDTRGWWPFRPRGVSRRPTANDVSFLLDPPAGRHGFVTTHPDGHLYYMDGTRARFWGVDIMAENCLPRHALARKMAERLARAGCNIVRLHHLDASWASPNVFDPRYADTRHLSPESMDRLDYFMAQLRRQGIYVYLDLLVNRHFKPGDGVRDWSRIDDGAKIVAHFDPVIIRREKEYARLLLLHQNRYTHRRLVDEPQIAAMEVINEDSLFYEQWYYLVPPSYLKQLAARCQRYEPTANPAKHPFDVPTLRALSHIEDAYYAEMRGYLRQLGVRCPTTGSNHWEDIGPALLCDSRTDYIDRHCYWDHPKGGFGWQQQFDNLPQLMHWSEGLVPMQAPLRVAGKPFLMTEWCFCWINDYIAEGPMIGAAYACLQDWDAMIWFDFTGGDWARSMDNEFDLGNKPHVFGQWAAAALLFHRRDLTPLQERRLAQVHPETLRDGRGLGVGFNSQDGFTRLLETRIGRGAESPLPDSPEPEQPVFVTPQVTWSAREGVLTINADRSVSVVGWCGGKRWKLGRVTVQPDTPFCAVSVSSLDGHAIGASRHLLITMAARAENSGAVYNAGRTSLKRRGHAPILMQPVSGRLELPIAGRTTVWPLDESGRRQRPLRSTSGAIRLGSPPALWYEVVRGPAGGSWHRQPHRRTKLGTAPQGGPLQTRQARSSETAN